MEKTKIFNVDLTENERKTILSLVEIEKGIPRLPERSLKEICEITKISNKKRSDGRKATDKGYQLTLLKNLKEKELVDKNKDKYFLKPNCKDIAINSIIQNKIKDLKGNGLFQFLDFYVFGIKKDWWKYPEIHYLHDVILDSVNIQYRIKQIKAIFLIRDFSKQWKKFLDSDVDDAIKYWIWKILSSRLSLHDGHNKFIDSQLELLMYSGVKNDNELKKYKDEIKKQYTNWGIEFKKEHGFKKRDTRSYSVQSLGEKIIKKMEEYTRIYSELMVTVIDRNLSKKEKKIVDDIFEWIFITYPTEANNIGVYIDTENLSRVGNTHMNIPIDEEEKLFRSIESRDKITLDRIKAIVKDTAVKTIDETLKDLFDVNDQRNYYRLSWRLGSVFITHVVEPKPASFLTPQLEEIKKDVVHLAKTEKWLYSSLIDKKTLKTDNDIFNKVEMSFNDNYIEKELHGKGNRIY